jgi:predicted dehydrogenase/threonine dehydrogenase-like Zn-dependent dehydrogenase
MKQILQSLNSGQVLLETIPAPKDRKGELLIQSHCTLISAGTERMLMDFGKASILGKIKQQPDKVKEVLAKVKTDGLMTTLDAIKSKLDQPISLGYCNVGHVLDAGGVESFQAGDRVLSNGAHAEIVRAPKNLCVKIPDVVTDEEAVFTVLGAIGLQGIRLLKPTLGECVVVQGLGLIGLMAVQLLIAHGCRVLGVDFDKEKLALAQQFGAEVVDLSAGENLITRAERFSRGRGVDAVLIAASAKTDDIVHQAATISRKRGRIILIGVVGLDLKRDDFYKKELSFQVSCSYGPGRYDADYEARGQDYPVGFVRWTEQRNMEAVLDMMATGKLDVKPLVSRQFAIDDAQAAYGALENRANLGIILQYPEQQSLVRTVDLKPGSDSKMHHSRPKAHTQIAFIGAGNYASRILMPAFKKTDATLATVITSQGVSGVIHGKKHGFKQAGTDFDDVLTSADVNTVVIATRHNLHAKQTLAALQSGKHVFVEKPLCLTLSELAEIEAYYNTSLAPPSLLMIGFNRRFSPHVKKIKALLQPISSPKNFIMTVNAGAIPKDHWTQDPVIGGGRLIGEGCHFIDLLRHLAGASIIHADISALAGLPDGTPRDENITVTLKFADGSCGTVHYFANGHKAFPKERLEVFADGKVIQMDNFRKMQAWGFKGFKKMNLRRQDKGQMACAQSFVKAIEMGGIAPIALEEVFEVTRVCIQLKKQL